MTASRRRQRRFAFDHLEGRAVPSGVGAQTSSFVRGLKGLDCDFNRGAINAGVAQASRGDLVNANVVARYLENAAAYQACLAEHGG